MPKPIIKVGVPLVGRPKGALLFSAKISSVPIVPVAWSPPNATNVTLSGDNLTATSVGGASTDQGVRIPPVSAKPLGKYYFEVALINKAAAGGSGIGVCNSAATYTNLNSSAAHGVIAFMNSGNIWIHGSNSGTSISGRATGDVIGVAVNVDDRRIWVRVAPLGNWNNNVSADPTSPLTGLSFAAMPSEPMPVCIFTQSGYVYTANFGAGAFVGAVPGGYTPGWSV